MSKKSLAIVMGVTDSWAFAAGTILLGLERYPLRQPHDVIVFHDGLSERNKKRLNAIHPCDFRAYDIALKDTQRFARLSKLTFARYECFGLLNDYERVAWVDADALIAGPIDAMMRGHRTGLAMYPHENVPISVSFTQDVPGYDMKRNCFNAGILVMDDRLLASDKLRAWCYEKTNEYADAISSDQAIINLMIQEFGLEVSPLNIRFNCPPRRTSFMTRIVHPWGTEKFWKGLKHPLWNRYYAQWRELGGDGPVIDDNAPGMRVDPIGLIRLKLSAQLAKVTR